MTTFDVDVVANRNFTRKIKGALRGIDAATEDRGLANFIVDRFKKRMAAGLQPGGEPFSPISPETRRWRRAAKNNPSKYGYGSGGLRITAPPLNFSGRLRESIGIRQGIFRINTGTGFRIGADANGKDGREYAATQQLGTDFIPARPFLGFDIEDEIAVTNRLKLRATQASGGALR